MSVARGIPTSMWAQNSEITQSPPQFSPHIYGHTPPATRLKKLHSYSITDTLDFCTHTVYLPPGSNATCATTAPAAACLPPPACHHLPTATHLPAHTATLLLHPYLPLASRAFAARYTRPHLAQFYACLPAFAALVSACRVTLSVHGEREHWFLPAPPTGAAG